MVLPLLTAAALCGQFPEHSVGIGAAAIGTYGNEGPLAGVTFEGNLRVWRGLELTLRVPLFMATQRANLSGAPIVGYDWAVGGYGGARYLFLTERVRPWFGAHLTDLNVVPTSLRFNRLTVLFGGGAASGVDFAVDRLVLGARVTYDAVLNLSFLGGHDVRHHLGFALSAAFGF